MSERRMPPDVGDAADRVRQQPDHTKPPAANPFGSKTAAGRFAGAGIMLGSNPDVWHQAAQLAAARVIQVVAVLPGTPPQLFAPARVVVWQPPEQEPLEGTDILQAENQAQWDTIRPHNPVGIVLNHWAYGKFPAGTVALVECYATDGPVDFGGPVGDRPNGEMFTRYIAAGASAVVAVPSGYPNVVPVEQAAAIYKTLPKDLPGVMVYAGEDPVDDTILAALREVWGRL